MYYTKVTDPPVSYGLPLRGITGRDVERAADALLRDGERPTIERVRERIGRGSPNTINPLLDAWWARLAARLDAGPAALHRLPETVAHVAEALWMQALDEARRRAAQEQSRQTRSAAKLADDLEVRSHVLTLREGELESRLRDRERAQSALETQVHELTTLLRKEQATRESQARRIATLEDQLLPQAQSKAKAPTRATRRRLPQPPKNRRAEKLLKKRPTSKTGKRPKQKPPKKRKTR
jgi:hypothetical protein